MVRAGVEPTFLKQYHLNPINVLPLHYLTKNPAATVQPRRSDFLSNNL